MEWRDDGFILSARSHGENSVIVEAFTKSHGRHAGVVRGGASRRMRPVLQPGAQVDLTWRARLEDHIGSFTVEPVRARSTALTERLSLAGLNAVTGLLAFTLPEREAHPALYALSVPLMDLLGQDDVWPLAYLQWEMALLEELGFGLDLRTCAVTGATDGLVYVSPRSGRAVSVKGAGEWADRLLVLSPAMQEGKDSTDADIVAALGTTGYFLEQKLAPQLGSKPLPEARGRLLDLFNRRLASL